MVEVIEQIIHQESVVGQAAAIRRINVADPEDMRRLRILENDSERIKWFESLPDEYSPMNDEELREFATLESGHLLYAVSGSIDVPGLPQSELGQLQGWIKVEPDNDYRREQMREKDILPPTEDTTEIPSVFEVTYAKLPTAPLKQMASGLRQVLVTLAHMNAMLDAESDEKGTKPNFIVTAYIINDERGTNVDSVKVLEAAGFVERTGIRYDQEAPHEDRLFVLDWEKLQTILNDASVRHLPLQDGAEVSRGGQT